MNYVYPSPHDLIYLKRKKLLIRKVKLMSNEPTRDEMIERIVQEFPESKDYLDNISNDKITNIYLDIDLGITTNDDYKFCTDRLDVVYTG